MTENFFEETVPHIFIVLPTTASAKEAELEAIEIISEKLDSNNFEIVNVRIIGDEIVPSTSGSIGGRRYMITFRQIYGKVIFIHPDYEKIIKLSP